MVPHIKKLALQALKNPANPYSEKAVGDIHCFDDDELEKFVTLILEDCFDQCLDVMVGNCSYDDWDHGYDAGLQQAITTISERFGMNKTSDLPDECQISLMMKCEECGHIQTVKGSRLGGVNYFGSSYNWCEECDVGCPRPFGEVKIRESDK